MWLYNNDDNDKQVSKVKRKEMEKSTAVSVV